MNKIVLISLTAAPLAFATATIPKPKIAHHPYAIQVLVTSVDDGAYAQRELEKLNALGLDCHLQVGQEKTEAGQYRLYGRCNYVDGYSKLKPGIALLEKHGIDYFVVNARKENILTGSLTTPEETVPVDKKRYSAPKNPGNEVVELMQESEKPAAANTEPIPKTTAIRSEEKETVALTKHEPEAISEVTAKPTEEVKQKVSLPYSSQGYAQVGLARKASTAPVIAAEPEPPLRSAVMEAAKAGTFQEYAVFYQRERNGTPGLGQLRETGLAVTLDAQIAEKHRLFLDLKMLQLDRGSLESGSYALYGTEGVSPVFKDSAKQSGLEPAIGYTYYGGRYTFEAEVGMTPFVWGTLDASSIWRLEATAAYGRFSGYARYVHEPIKESMIAYVGANDIFSDLSWGRILKKGVAAGLLYSNGFTASFDLERYPAVEGDNTLSNSEVSATAELMKNLEFFNFKRFTLGGRLFYDNYELNTNYYTYGQGGYFSPQDYLAYTLCIDMIAALSEHSLLQLKGNWGKAAFEQAPMTPYHDQPAVMQTQSEKAEEYVTDVAAYLGIGFGDEFRMLAAAGYTNKRLIDEYFFGLQIGFYFDKTDIDVSDLVRLERLYRW